jgi:2-polyprenyl-3-methyl-5-hydroxy-6-metoxy-1,4-benzoquinol methylase
MPGGIRSVQSLKKVTDEKHWSDGAVNQCPSCGFQTHAFFTAPDWNRKVSAINFHVVRCAACRLCILADPPSDLSRYYVAGYHKKLSDAASLEPLLAWHKYKLDLVRKYRTSGSVLEIGPSNGQFCLLAKRGGFDVSAIEMDEECVQFLNDKLAIPTVQSADPSAAMRLAARSYDVICMWQVLEHMAKPWDVLEAAVAHLNPGGQLIIACPNPDAWQAKLMGRRWPHWDLPRHLYAIPIPWLVAQAGKHGLVCELATTNDQGSTDLNRVGWAMLLSRIPLCRLGAGMLANALRRWEQVEGSGSCYCVVLRKPAA